MRKLKVLAATLAMMLLFAAPASAQVTNQVAAVGFNGGLLGPHVAFAEAGQVQAVAIDRSLFRTGLFR